MPRLTVSQTENDAQRAITMGRGMLITGRPCRTEVAKVNRKPASCPTFFLLGCSQI